MVFMPMLTRRWIIHAGVRRQKGALVKKDEEKL